jgi:hypothetical protein
MSLMAFSVAAGYLVIYFNGGVGVAFANTFGRVSMPRIAMPARRARASAPVVRSQRATPAPQVAGIPAAMGVNRAPIVRAQIEHVAPVAPVAHVSHVAPKLPVAEHARVTMDTMTAVRGHGDELPRLVISRA